MAEVAELLAQLRQAMGAAQAEFVRGNPEPLKSLISHGDDVTVLGAFGGYVRGRESVASRLDWASAQFREGTWSSEDVSFHGTDDLACLVSIERTEAVMGDDEAVSLQELRVTHVFRREGDAFKIVHRHADPLRPTTAPAGRGAGTS